MGPTAKPSEREDDDYHAYQYRDKTMYFVEFYADWLSLCNTVDQQWFRANSCGTSTPTATALRSWNFCKWMWAKCLSWPRGSTLTLRGSRSSCRLSSFWRTGRRTCAFRLSRRATKLTELSNWTIRFCWDTSIWKAGISRQESSPLENKHDSHLIALFNCPRTNINLYKSSVN